MKYKELAAEMYRMVNSGQAMKAFEKFYHEDSTMVEAWSEVTFQDGNRMKLEEIARQKWHGDQIIEERFYYNPGPMSN